MLSKKQIIENNRSKAAYVGFLFQSFLKRPFGYVVAILYVVYLAIILLIVPACLHFEPLFIWNVGGFNMPMFNLFFIAAATASAAVAVFRTGIDDGTELNLSSKPLTKNSRVAIKTFVYLAIMLAFCAVALIITVLIKPVFGEYDILYNRTGIANDKYISLILSVLLGNIINMLFFGGISVLISMVGGQVIIMVGTIGFAFLLCLLNVIYPMAISSPVGILRDKYNTSINSYSANTLSQFNKTDDTEPKKFAAIQCITEQDGTEINHFDTHEYWTKANVESGRSVTNYVDIAKQLSSLFSSFGLDESRLTEASKLSIGANNSYTYKIDEKTHINSAENINNKNYPIALYSTTSNQGITYPIVYILGGNMGLESNNWYVQSTLTQTNFDSIIMASTSHSSTSSSYALRSLFTQPWFRMKDLVVTQQQYDAAVKIFNQLIELKDYDEEGIYKYTHYSSSKADDEYSANTYIKSDTSGAFFEVGTFDKLPNQKQLLIMSQFNLIWMIRAQEVEKQMIDKYILEKGIDDAFPYSTKTVINWYFDNVVSKEGVTQYDKDFWKEKWLEQVFESGIWVNKYETETGQDINVWSQSIRSTVNYCETYSNLYQYNVKSVYNIYVLITVWAVISAGLFTTSIVVYKRTDFK